MTWRVVTWNVNGIRKRMPEVLRLVAETRPDVLCLQEIKAAPEQIAESLTALPDYWTCWHGALGGYSGVSLHLRKGTFGLTAAPRFSHPDFDVETRIVQASVDWQGTPCVIASLYLPNGGKDFPAKLAFMREAAAYVAGVRASGSSLILCGDLNVARAAVDVHPSQRRVVIGQLPEERALFDAIVESGSTPDGDDPPQASTGLVDLHRALHPTDERLYTWWPSWPQARIRNLGWRLDYVLASPRIAASARACAVHRVLEGEGKGLPFGTSDHAPLVADFEA